MSLTTITLYENCRLTNKYDEVFLSGGDRDTYLSTLTKKDIYLGEDIYVTNNGSLSIDNEISGVVKMIAHGDKYNYMSITVAGETTRFFFVDSITLVDSTCVIEYREDIWHSYALTNNVISFNMKNSIIAQANGLNASSEYDATDIANLPKKLPIEYQGHNAPTFKIDNNNYKLISNCYVLVIA